MSFFRTNKKKTETPKETQKVVEELEKRVQELQNDLAGYKELMKSAVTKVGIVRFNPFHEIGSDQSFSLAFLDQENNGFVLTSHYLKEANRVYAKPVKNGSSQYPLSDEETEAMKKAMTNDK
jgi:hypothetical protein